MSKPRHDRDSNPGINHEPEERGARVSRRQVLAGGASVALVGLVGVTDTRAQYTGIM